MKFGFLHLLRRPVRKGLFRLRQVEEPVHDVIGDRRHGLSHIAFKGVVLRHLVQSVRHVRDPLNLVGDVGFPRLVEKLRILDGQLGINLVNIGMLALADFQLAEQTLTELVEVRDLGGVRFRQRQLRVFQILPQTGVFLVCPVIHLHGAFRDPLRNGVSPSPRLGIGQLVLTVLAAGNVVIQALQVSGNVATADLRAVVLYQRIRRLLNGFLVGGHALRPSGLALPVLHPLFQALVLPFQRRQLLGVLRAFQRQELCQFRNMGLRSILEIRLNIIQNLAGMSSSRIFCAGNRLPIRGVQIKNDLTAIFTDKVRQCIHLGFCRLHREVDPAAFRGNADVPLAHKLHHRAGIIIPAVILANGVPDVPVVYRPVSAGAALVPPGEVQLCACRGQISGLVPVVGFAEKRDCLFTVVPLLRIAVIFQGKANLSTILCALNFCPQRFFKGRLHGFVILKHCGRIHYTGVDVPTHICGQFVDELIYLCAIGRIKLPIKIADVNCIVIRAEGGAFAVNVPHHNMLIGNHFRGF